MTLFNYRAVDATGKIVRGQTSASGLTDLEHRLHRMTLDLIHGEETSRTGGGRWRVWPDAGHISRRELIKFCIHLEQFLQAGVPMIESLQDLQDSIANPRFRLVIGDILQGIEGGLSLSLALEKHPTAFSPVFTSLIRAGEHTGSLPEVLRALSSSLKRDDELVAYGRRIVIYPAIVCMTIAAALGVALVFVVPELARLFQNANLPLPWQTKALLWLSERLIHQGPWLAGIALLGCGVLYHQLKTSIRLRRHYDRTLLSLPILGPIRRKIILARFTNLFAMMYSSGITIIDGLRITEGAIGNLALQEGLQEARQLIEQGCQLSEAFRRVDLFPGLVSRMLGVGERTGALDSALANVGYFYDRDVREAIAQLQASIEPTLTLVLGTLLLGVMGAVLMPVYDIVTQLKL
ncbi:type II secretion system F family protein [Zoogloea sp.]|uniref:type II secretion system F family protein n=1 Tax=Zoogloea sp. TaxID=49181 RepID=UPI002621D207|nr:type II secretion system F family protein [Zoogloea sp.]MDD3353120.1 type II secretion system F family protein [Zoogloea sp.]